VLRDSIAGGGEADSLQRSLGEELDSRRTSADTIVTTHRHNHARSTSVKIRRRPMRALLLNEITGI